MLAAIYHGPGGISIETRPIPQIGKSDVLIRNLRAGICGTDINIIKEGALNRGIQEGAEFGHEMIGEVMEVGEAVSSRIRKGMLVGINPITAKRAGRRHSLQCGGFSQYIRVEDARLDYNLFEMSAGVPLEVSALMEPISVGRHGAFKVKPLSSDKIVVLGAGPIGLSAAASLIAEGITNVCIIDIDSWRLAKAVELGAKIVNPTERKLKEELIDRFGTVEVHGRIFPDVDVFIDSAGAPELIREVIATAKPEARISVIAVYKKEVAISLSQIMSNEIQLVGSSGYTTEDIKAVVGYLNDHKINFGAMVSKVYKLADIQEAFREAIAAKEVIKVLIDLT